MLSLLNIKILNLSFKNSYLKNSNDIFINLIENNNINITHLFINHHLPKDLINIILSYMLFHNNSVLEMIKSNYFNKINILIIIKNNNLYLSTSFNSKLIKINIYNLSNIDELNYIYFYNYKNIKTYLFKNNIIFKYSNYYMYPLVSLKIDKYILFFKIGKISYKL